MRPFDDVDLHAYVDNQVGPHRHDAIGVFLGTAPGDAERVARWQRQNEAIRGVFAGVAEEAVPLWLTVGQIDLDRSKPVPLPRKPPAAAPARPGVQPADGASGRKPGSTLVAAALAFAAGLCVPYAAAQWPALDAVHLLPSQPTARQAFARRALEAHATFSTDADRPVEIADGPDGALKHWLDRRVSFAVHVPDLQAEGWTLRGGRIAPAERGSGALLVYDNSLGDRLSLFSARLPAKSGDEAPGAVDADGVLSWVDDGIGMAVVTTRSPTWLARNARLLYTAIHGAPAAE